MAKRKKKEEPKGFTIVCRECGFSGGVKEFSITAFATPCDLCGEHGDINIGCRNCHSEMEVESW